MRMDKLLTLAAVAAGFTEKNSHSWNDVLDEINHYLTKCSYYTPPGWHWGDPIPNGWSIPNIYMQGVINTYIYCVKKKWIPPYCGWTPFDKLPHGYKDPDINILINTSYYLNYCYLNWLPPFIEWKYGYPIPNRYPLPPRISSVLICKKVYYEQPQKQVQVKPNKYVDILPKPNKKRKRVQFAEEDNKQLQFVEGSKKKKGRWSKEEHIDFINYLITDGSTFERRTKSQIRSHLQKCNKQPQKWFSMKALFFVKEEGEEEEEEKWFHGYYNQKKDEYIFDDGECIPRNKMTKSNCITWTFLENKK